jgi:hypothetical protein
MKTSFKTFSLLAALAVVAASAQADTLKLSQDKVNYSVLNGGAFIATPNDGPISNSDYSGAAQIAGGGFLTFCIEYNEEFSPSNISGYSYNYALNYGAVNGGQGGQPAATPQYDGISNATAFLYSQFAQGTLTGLAGFDYNLTGYGALQQAIWYLEGEAPYGTNNLLAQAAIAHEGANWNSDNNGAYGVQALNLTYADGSVAQDQLYFHNVPDQGLTVALLGLSLLGLVGFRRKFFGAK